MNSVNNSTQAEYPQSNIESIPLHTKLYNFFNYYFCCNSSNGANDNREFAPISLHEPPHDSTAANVSGTAHFVLVSKGANRSKPEVKKSSTPLNPPSYRSEDIQLLIQSIDRISSNFTTIPINNQRIAHTRAKEFLTQSLKKIGASVTFVSPPTLSNKVYFSTNSFTPLLKGVFYWEDTQGIAENIQRDGNRNEDNIVLYGVASQFNGVSGQQHIPIPGRAVHDYKSDLSEGAEAQLQFHPHQVELINCGGNLGFNGLINILNQKIVVSTLMKGYLNPSLEDADEVISALVKDGIEYICVANRPYNKKNKNYGNKPVHMMLVYAPTFDKSMLENNEKRNQIEFLCALQSFRAQFQHCIDLAQREGKSVIFKAAGVGLGIWSNQETNVAKGFYIAAKEFETQLQENGVLVRLQVMGGTGRARDLAKSLQLSEWI